LGCCGEAVQVRSLEKQIPFGNDRKKGQGKDRSRFPEGMTERKATAEADSLQESQIEKQWQRQRQEQIPFRNDRKKGNDNDNGRSRFPSGMTDRKATARAKAEADSPRE